MAQSRRWGVAHVDDRGLTVSVFSLLCGIAFFAFCSFVISVILVRLNGDEGLGLLLRKKPWLFLASPLFVLLLFLRAVVQAIFLFVLAANTIFRTLFEKATGRKTYRRSRLYNNYRYRR